MGYVLVVRVFDAREGGDGTYTRECARLALLPVLPKWVKN